MTISAQVFEMGTSGVRYEREIVESWEGIVLGPWELSVLSAQFLCKPKIMLKNIVY